MARVLIALVVAVLLRSYQAAVVELDAIDFMHNDDKGQEKCKKFPEGIVHYCISYRLWRSRDP